MERLTPRQIVAELDKYIIGQHGSKQAEAFGQTVAPEVSSALDTRENRHHRLRGGVLDEGLVLEGVLGYPHGEVEHLFRNLPLIAAALLAVGVLIISAGAGEAQPDRSGLSLRHSAMIGTVQGLYLPFRGFSHSGATISTALFCGIRRDLAEDFSFALAVILTPPVILLELRRLLKASGPRGVTGTSFTALMLPGILGKVGSSLAGLVALRWLSVWLERGRWRYFGYYCVFFSAVVFLSYRLGP